jgi:predicted RNA-binding protein with TRAM domain
VTVDVTDLHESGAGIGHTEDGFVVMVDGILPDARARVEITTVKSNFARGDVVERLPLDPDETDDADADGEDADADEDEATGDESGSESRTAEEQNPRLGSRENFWGA